ncbi:hypothetical protein [Paraburkholderia bannensis]|uniref:hypothetical protein n=1 Tax=Paraburkholderia bannensis TaxID=765414 RepID=UPI002ABE5ABB|nr:hypothetical protein [Paraburkholderia bannensis]
MIKIQLPLPVSDAVALSKMRKRTELSNWVDQLNSAYLLYLTSFGSATKLAANKVGLDATASGRMETCYRDETILDGLDWISTVRAAKHISACPMCGGFSKGTLEHVLPKADFPEFYVFSANLVPSCQVCNGKRSNTASAAGILHPYFDAFLAGSILETQIIPPFEAPSFAPKAICFFALSDETISRLVNHTTRSINVDEFSSYAEGRWRYIRERAKRFKSKKALTTDISDTSVDYEKANGCNNWEGAFWRGLKASPSAIQWLFANRNNASLF